MDGSVASPSLLPWLKMGKYTRWTERLDADTLWAALWAVGEFGSRFWEMRRPDGTLPTPVFEEHFMAEERMVRALWAFATIRGTGRLTTKFMPGFEDELSFTLPAFAQPYRDGLALDSRTAWSAPMDQQSFGFLLWEIGEYGIRVNSSRGPDGGEYPPPIFEGPDDQVGPMRAALRLIARVENGKRMTRAEAEEIMSAG